jgi:hypothetical protein
MLRRVVSSELTNTSAVLTTFINSAMIKVAVSTSETSVNFYQTLLRNIPEGSHLHTCSCENLKTHKLL